MRIVDEHGYPEDDFDEEPRMTNFDRLKELGAEDVAIMFCMTGHCLPKMLDGDYPRERCLKFSNKCIACISDYLQSEAKEDGRKG